MKNHAMWIVIWSLLTVSCGMSGKAEVDLPEHVDEAPHAVRLLFVDALGEEGCRERTPNKRGVDPSVRVDIEIDEAGQIIGGKNVPRKVLIDAAVNTCVDLAIKRVTGTQVDAPAGVHRVYLKLEA
jgi:hypothetical protein